MVAQRPDGIIDPGLKFYEIGGRRLRPCRSKAEEDNRQQKQQLPQPQRPPFHHRWITIASRFSQSETVHQDPSWPLVGGNAYASKLNDRVVARDAAFSAMSRYGRAPRRRESLVEEE